MYNYYLIVLQCVTIGTYNIIVSKKYYINKSVCYDSKT